METRRRRAGRQENVNNNNNNNNVETWPIYKDPLKHQRTGELTPFGVLHWLLVLATCSAVLYVSMWAHGTVPTPKDPGSDTEFSERRARIFLDKLAALGPKPSASHACEVLASELILNEVESIKSRALQRHQIDVDVQRPSGCYYLPRFDGFTLCYKKLLNIVVRLGSTSRAKPADHSLLINCHFDSWPTSPAASDDGVSCASMLEILRVLTQSERSFEHDIIFLFNGAEENILMSAHGFITTHPWRHSIRAFLNLEAAGSGGRELLFQAGPGNQWILNTYLRSAPRPHCSVMGQEVFESGVVPGDTDFRIFRDFGKLSGLDLAFIRNGYVYHTEFDQPQFISNGSVQRAGENTLQTVIALADSPYLAHPTQYKQGRSVFFDVVGLVTIVYPFELGQLMNYTVLLLVLARVTYMLWLHHKQTSFGGNAKSVTSYSITQLFGALLVQYLAAICMLAGVFVCSLIIHTLNAMLCWYATPSLLLFVYILPLLMIGAGVHALAKRWFDKKTRPEVLESCVFDAQLLVNSVTLFTMTSLGFASAFFWMFTTVFPLLRIPAVWLWNKICQSGQSSSRFSSAFFILHTLTALPSLLLVVYCTALMIDLFIPIMGRSLAVNSEIPIGCLCFLGAIGIVVIYSSLIYVTSPTSLRTLAVSCVLFLTVMYTLLAFKWIGAPYHYDPDHPRLRRLQLQHVSRHFYDSAGNLKSSDAGLLYLPLDHRGVADLPPETELNECPHPFKCTDDLGRYCNIPYYVAVSRIIPPRHFCWKPVSDEPDIKSSTLMKLLNRDDSVRGQVNMTFYVEGSDHMSLQLTPQQGWMLNDWSFDVSIVHHIDTSFVYLTYGESPTKEINSEQVPYSPWQFWVVLKHNPNVADKTSDYALNLGVASHYVHGDQQFSARLSSLITSIKEHRAANAHDWRWAITPAGWNIQFAAAKF